jgi:tight adherence protein B
VNSLPSAALLFHWTVHGALYKWSALLLAGFCIACLTYRVMTEPLCWPRRAWTRYVTHLERKLRDMFLQTSGSVIATTQIVLIVVTIGLRLLTRTRHLEWITLVIAMAPALYIEQMRRNRLKAIEKQIDSFIVSFASALKTTPSIGQALSSVHELLSPPLQDEIGLVLKEMRVGNTLEQSLLNLGGRIPVVELDATLASILIGRQVGGNLPEILETTAATLREMSRLQGVMRSKTASGKLQIVVLFLAPPIVVLGFDLAKPGYFDPMTSSAVGVALITIATMLWIGSVVIARKIIRVQL